MPAEDLLAFVVRVERGFLGQRVESGRADGLRSGRLGGMSGPSASDDTGDDVVRSTEQEAQANLRTVLQLCATGALRCSEKTRRPSAATVATVAGALAGGDFYPTEPIIAFAWPLLVQAGGLAELAGGRLRLTAKGRAASGREPAPVIRELWERWVSHGSLDEMSRIEQIKGQRAANVLTALRPRRQAVATALATRCPPGEWVPIDELFRGMRRARLSPTVARNERSLWKLYIAESMYGSLGYDGFHDWSLLEDRYTLCVLFEYAATLGLIDVTYTDPAGARDDFRDNWGTDDLDALSRYDGLLALRCTALGAYVLGHAQGYEPADGGAVERTLKVLPTLDVVAVGEIAAADRILLEAYAVRTSDRVGTLTASTLLAALSTGRTVDELRQLLAGRAQPDLPTTVISLLDDADQRAGQLRDLGLARIVECADPTIAALIARDRRTHCTLLGDRHLAVPVDKERAFRTRLHALGYALGNS